MLGGCASRGGCRLRRVGTDWVKVVGVEGRRRVVKALIGEWRRRSHAREGRCLFERGFESGCDVWAA